ncbi:MAG: hypothetical protein GWM98_19630, partial [Nitrospinaceae bacterium]|nr:hypothetical protein [Nitrospinaceae bacterium]NIR56286.1 hypothetical protein [Nitrospinaceae bacterium]NIS86743.1 hypothetical protein [Nitrospinaceae bacterium]NIT83578.1 hypothetical protein [Nitrospinaceae bacterium]NIU45780.1 hypothetical protein [Nitrospinaceae bacterium]
MPRIGWAFRVGLIGVLMLGWMVPPLFAAEGSEGGLEACKPLEEQPVKVEGWISKKFRKDKRKIIEELGRLGHTRVRVRIFP